MDAKKDIKTYRKTDLHLLFVIEKLYGRKDYKRLKTNHNLTIARNAYLKIVKSIKFAINETILTIDNTHRKKLDHILGGITSDLKESINLDELDQRMISFQTELVFTLIGFCPDRIDAKRIINNKEIWKLDNYRQIVYIQNDEQKKNIIFKAVQGKYASKFGKWNDFVNTIFQIKCRNSASELVKYIKSEYPEIYMDLF